MSNFYRAVKALEEADEFHGAMVDNEAYVRAQQVAEVMNAGERAEAANPEPHQSSLQYAIRHKQLLQNRPDEWLQQLATGLGAATWDL